MNGKWPVLAILVSAVAVGAGVWYTQEYGYYARLDPSAAQPTVVVDGKPVPLGATDLEAIDANSSPIRWRACFRLAEPLPAGAEPFPNAEPLVGPRWFSCFDAGQIDRDLASGAATAYLGQSDIRPGADRVIAVYPDGRAYGWHQLNEAAEEKRTIE
ncbi:DUF6446 family protein [Paracoccus pacificus]|uniref:DUF6446 family protein n=1 Tax=Paracoccus pacificus TaxID=1463598 RepID=A0ABW4R311_9RHOB